MSSVGLDAKGRMSIPTKYRDQLMAECDGCLVLTLDRSPNLLMIPLPVWDVLQQELMSIGASDKAVRLRRLYLGSAEHVKMDNAGRILVSPELRKRIGLEAGAGATKACVVGQGGKFEIWRAVLLDEAVEALIGPGDGVYLDCTYGRGGHSARILERLGQSGQLIAFDRDGEAQAHAEGVASGDERFRFVRENFANLEAVVSDLGLSGRIDGVLMDLGVSSPQLDEAERGFSFRKRGPLDMRMDTSQPETAASWLATASEQRIADVLYRYGEERRSRRIARRICEVRDTAALETTTELAELVASVVGRCSARFAGRVGAAALADPRQARSRR